MLIKENESLSQYTTFKMGGVAKRIYFPENVEELKSILLQKPIMKNYLIGGGSNLLINEQKVFDDVLCLKNFNNTIVNHKNGMYYIGASVRLQKVIRTINEDGYGGIEYLYSVPGLVGGAVYMNAGRGKKYNKSISDYILSVDVLIDGEIKTFTTIECGFTYRKSVFQDIAGCVILGVLFQFPTVSQEDSKKYIQERIDLCKSVQDMSLPNYGTVFCESNKYIMRFIKIIGLGYKDGCRFSGKTTNWMLHGANGTFEQADVIIKKVEYYHKIFRQRCRVEVKVWR